MTPCRIPGIWVLLYLGLGATIYARFFRRDAGAKTLLALYGALTFLLFFLPALLLRSSGLTRFLYMLMLLVMWFAAASLTARRISFSPRRRRRAAAAYLSGVSELILLFKGIESKKKARRAFLCGD